LVDHAVSSGRKYSAAAFRRILPSRTHSHEHRRDVSTFSACFGIVKRCRIRLTSHDQKTLDAALNEATNLIRIITNDLVNSFF
jgi:hypothetical protein